jgi:hypothetical protein
MHVSLLPFISGFGVLPNEKAGLHRLQWEKQPQRLCAAEGCKGGRRCMWAGWRHVHAGVHAPLLPICVCQLVVQLNGTSRICQGIHEVLHLVVHAAPPQEHRRVGGVCLGGLGQRAQRPFYQIPLKSYRLACWASLGREDGNLERVPKVPFRHAAGALRAISASKTAAHLIVQFQGPLILPFAGGLLCSASRVRHGRP